MDGTGVGPTLVRDTNTKTAEAGARESDKSGDFADERVLNVKVSSF